jgi:hypothetical protein
VIDFKARPVLSVHAHHAANQVSEQFVLFEQLLQALHTPHLWSPFSMCSSASCDLATAGKSLIPTMKETRD